MTNQPNPDWNAYTPLLDGATLTGWHAEPRLPTARYPGGQEPERDTSQYRAAASSRGRWTVEDGAIVGRQDPPGSGLGGYLVSDERFGDFDLLVEARPDWPADTGVMVRATPSGTQGFQVLVDHRKSGGIGGFYGNGIGGFHALAFNVDVRRDDTGNPFALQEEDPATTLEPVTPDKRAMLTYAVDPQAFLAAWRWNDWNLLRIRCVGTYPTLTTWVNGTKLYELDTSKIKHPDYDADTVLELLGRKGHIAFEIHDNDPRMGEDRWGPTAACRWRNPSILEL
jgi:Domain of Unknown Function (DUF1080)